MIVADSNVLAALLLSSEGSVRAELVKQKDSCWIVPSLWRHEVLNILATQLKTRRLNLNDARRIWSRAVGAFSANESDPTPEFVLELVFLHSITAYDAQFVAVARNLGCTLVTEDAELQRKFPGLAMSMETFLSQGNETLFVRETPATYGSKSRGTTRKPFDREMHVTKSKARHSK